ncbi:MAG TPA: hypothetical protein VGW77_17080 [Candidatus Binatia bacterium]|jgi:hypothetical protein|nr:hypothetical protein [Candidatus Binatia bacterium]
MIRRISSLLAVLLCCGSAALASNHYTDKQLAALATRVGKTFWISGANDKAPSFLTEPSPGATTFRPEENDSFEITELTGQKIKDPYYKVKFESGKVGYIRPETFHEEFNVKILSQDPLADQKRKAEDQAAEEKKRLEWIKSQPWSPAVKAAAIKKQPTPGLNGAEVKRVLGAPTRVSKTRGTTKTREERWFYTDGSVLTFHNGLLSSVEKRENK